jgi:threonine/homoserine/homoserine lactone efflux protein
VFLGVRRFLENEGHTADAIGKSSPHNRASSLIARAFLALNPKTALFFFALFPQVVDLHAGPGSLQMLLFGAAFTVLGLVTNSIYGCLGRRLASRLAANESFRSPAKYAAAGTLIGLGLFAAVSD